MLVQLALIGMVAALFPALGVLRSGSGDRYRKLVIATLILTFELIMFGAFTRLTDSGLGCPDWPGCYGQADPIQAHADIHAAEAAMPTGPVTPTKAWIEMLHRYLAMAIGVLIIGLMVLAWRRWFRPVPEAARISPWYPTIVFGFVCLQGAFGAWTVTMKLQPIIVTSHLLLGLTLLALLTWLMALQSEHGLVSLSASTLRAPAFLAAVLLLVQIALGAWVSTNYAALACLDFPLCNGHLLPEMDFSNGFALWRDLGKTSSGEFLPFPALTAIHWTHRGFAVAVTLVLAWLGFSALNIEGLRKTARWILIALVLQVLSGIASVFLKLPLALAVAHNGNAALLVLLLVMLNYKARIPAMPESSQAYPGLSST
jgi:cytochrome c oxidase assembly protein subunit 15